MSGPDAVPLWRADPLRSVPGRPQPPVGPVRSLELPARADWPVEDPGPASTGGADWVVRAQDGQAAEVLAEIEHEVDRGIEGRPLARALYARAICLLMLGQGPPAVQVARELTVLCRDLELKAVGLQARALLVDLLRRDGQLEKAVEQLAHAVAVEQQLRDLADPEVQAGLGALAVALRLSGVPDEARRVEQRLASVEPDLPRLQRVARWSNLAFEHAAQAMEAVRRPPFEADVALLARAVADIALARKLARWGSYDIVGAESDVVAALQQAVVGDPAQAYQELLDCRSVLDRGPEAISAQLFWGAAAVRALVRLDRPREAGRVGGGVLARVPGSGRHSDRMILAYEVMRAEHPDVEEPGSGTAEFLALNRERRGVDGALVAALFRARVDLVRGADERRTLARAASLDPLTGLVNRRGAASAIADAAARAAGEAVAMLLIDLDGFKEVNDSAGHLAGDLVLRRVSVALRTAARQEDVVARWGGDEFVVVAELDHDRALALADRLRETIREGAWVGGTGGVTGSIGVAVRDRPLDEETWLRRADEAMYAAKRSGGDATVLG